MRGGGAPAHYPRSELSGGEDVYLCALLGKGGNNMLNRVVLAAAMAAVLISGALAADVTGAWQFSLVTPTTKGSPSFEFKQEGESLSGTYSGKFGKAPISGTVKGDEVEFSFQAPNATGKFHYKGTIEGGSMKGDFELEGSEKGTFTATKK